MALPKEPRQKMINIMYLVLTALLALNVSAEILNAFKTVDNSLRATNETIKASTNTIMQSLQAKLNDPTSAEKARIWYPKALQAQQLSSAMYNYIQSLRDRILKEAGFNPNANNKYDSSYKLDNLDIATRIMIEQKEGPKLRAKLAQYKKDLLGIDPAIAKEFQNSLQIDLTPPKVQDKSNKAWEAAYFHMVPTVAAITILSKFQNDVKTSENKVVAFCHQQVGQVEVRFDKFAPIVGQSSNYLMPGQQITITAGVGAFNSQALPEISIGGAPQKVENGVATYTVQAQGAGEKSIPVNIRFKNQDGQWVTYPTEVKYTVGQANASIALDDMNVLYIGIDNKLTIAASGGGNDKTQATISGGGGSITKAGNGKWIARVNSITDNATITVSVDGKVAGAAQFRVRTIPPAYAYVGGFESGANIAAGAFINQAGVGAGIKNFPLNLSYRVTSFTVTCDNDAGDVESVDCQGNTWSPRASSMIRKNVKPGRLVTVDNIRVQGPDGRITPAPSLVYYIR